MSWDPGLAVGTWNKENSVFSKREETSGDPQACWACKCRAQGVCLGVCTPRCLSVKVSWGRVGGHVGWYRSPYMGCLFWSYSRASNSSLALRVEADRSLALLSPPPVPLIA